MEFLFIGGFIVLLLVFLYFVPINLWITAVFSGVRIGLLELVFMRIRRAPVREVVQALIASYKGGTPLKLIELETHALRGGDVTAVTKALLKAKIDGVETTFKEVSEADISGKNLSDFIDQKKSQPPSYAARTQLCEKIMKDLSEAQVKELESFVISIDK